MKHIKNFESHITNPKIVVCDKSIYHYVTQAFKDAKIYDRDSNSGIISTLKSLISKGHTNITFVIDDEWMMYNKRGIGNKFVDDGKKSSSDQRLDFIEEFMGQDFKKINVIKSSEI